MRSCLRLFARVFAVTLLLGAVAAFAADVTGKWTGEVSGHGQSFPIAFTFKADGTSLTGKMSGPMERDFDISEGKINGDEIAFTVHLEISDNPITLHYTGKVSGDEIKLSLKTDDGNFDQDFTVRRTS